MAEYITGMNPAIIKWARERSGYSLEEAAAVIKKDVATLSDWESGGSAPTYVQLEKLADKYKRPVAIFFFPEPPEEPDIAGNLARQSSENTPISPRMHSLLRQAYARQISLMELNLGVNPMRKKIFRELQAQPDDVASELARKTRVYLDVSIDTQLGWRNTKAALENWQDIVYREGIFVFKEAFRDDSVDGFCIAHEEFPVIYLNNSSPLVRQIFSLFHELAHLLLGENGMTRGDFIRGGDIEDFCNQFAAEFLVPDLDLETRLTFSAYDDDAIETLANQYKVSRPIILLKLVNRGILTREDYAQKIEGWTAERGIYERKKSAGENPILMSSGPEPSFHELKDVNAKSSGRRRYYKTRATYLGYRFMELAFSKYHQGQCSIEQLAEHLDVKVEDLPELENNLLRKADN